MTKNTSTSKPITSTKHGDKRTNIPTEELRDFVAADEKNPEILRYPRDPSLDPQLVWKGKDEQDGEDLVVSAVPIYIQEKIHPHAIIEDVRAQAQKGPSPQMEMFSDFNGLPFEDLIEFYEHQQNWTNRLILGDSLQVMTSLAEKEGLKGQVQMIYLDPPYGIKFGSNWQVSTRKREVRDGNADDVVRQPEQVKAFRDTWELGIHSYLSYMRDRLRVARDLLTDSGSLFVQIGDENVHLVRCLLDEVFGAENFVAMINYKTMTPLGASGLAKVFDYLLWYGRSADRLKFNPIFAPKKLVDNTEFAFLERDDGSYRRITPDERSEMDRTKDGEHVFKRTDLVSSGYTPTCVFSFEFEGNEYSPRGRKSWRTNVEGMQRLIKANRLFKLGSKPYMRMRYLDSPYMSILNSWDDTAGGFTETKRYVVETNPKIIERCMQMASDPGDLVLDPTCGSGTSAYVAEQLGRRWITIDTSRVSLTLARTRFMAARFPYYLLADTPEGVTKQMELSGQLPDPELPPQSFQNNIRKGFIYERVHHIMLRDITNNEEIDFIYARFQELIEPSLKALGGFDCLKGVLEWDLPRKAEKDWPREVKDKLAKYWSLRRQRQSEIDASIARNSEDETLYDKPYEDSKKLRVSGPFTVESLSPHRVLAVDEPRPASESAGETASSDFSGMILDNLKKAGVQNTVKNERLRFDRLEPYAGEWLQAEGEYTEKDENVKRVAVCIGPEHGTVGPQLIKEAAKEAVRGVGFDLLLVCGFAFDPHVAEEAQRYGDLTVLPVRMNPDLAMGDTLLKKTGSGNLFMVFGEPDVEINTTKEGQLVVEIRGLDIYDPTTGQIRSSSTDDIACWFIDTEYNEESFFVRHAYFTGADKPYDKLKRSLRAEINEEAWESLYRTTSRPFEKPKSSKIAIKVINHYGDEVLKVYDV